MTISRKITLLLSSSIIILVLLFGVIAYVLIGSFGNDNAHKTLMASQKTMQASIESLRESLTFSAGAIMLNAELAEAVMRKDSAKARRLAASLIKGNVEFFTVSDMEGKILARGHSDKAGDQTDEKRLTVSVPLREGRTIIGLEPGTQIPLTLAAGVPLTFDGRQVGVATFGMDLSSGKFVAGIKESMGVESTIFLDDLRVSTTVMRDGKPVINTKLNNPAIYDPVMRQGQTVLADNVIAGTTYDTIYWPWKALDGKNAGIFFVGLSRDSINATLNRITIYFLLCGVLAGALMIGAGIAFARALARPIIQAKDYAERVSSGDFKGTLEVTSRDEVGILSNSLRLMVENLKSKIAEADERSREAAEQAVSARRSMEEAQQAKQKAENSQKACLNAAEDVEEVVSQLVGAAGNLNGQITQASGNALSQQKLLASCATAMEEMNATVLEVARNASVAADGSSNARQKAQNGADIVERSIQGLERVQDEAQTLREIMDKLGHEAESIGAVITVINDIADQTNLLALNAAIEAARAGEAGRGFAVVADEVRKLAEKTMTATKEVGTVITSIQQHTRKSLESVDRTGDHLGTASKLAAESGVSLREIVDESVATADQVGSIAAASEEQSAASEEITRSLEDINRSSTQTADTMHESTRAVHEVAGQVNQLRELVGKLRQIART